MRSASPMSIAALSATVLFAGCSGTQPSVSPSGTSNAVASSRARHAYAGLHALYVADYGYGIIFVIPNDGGQETEITDGINGPQADFLDAAGNLYVANATGVNVAEYAPGATSPSFVYSAGMVFPINVAVDRNGNVYEADYGTLKEGSTGFINEYAQNSNTVVQTCSFSGRGEGIALDPSGDVFASYNVPRMGGRFVEYKGGLSGCKATPLHVLAHGAGGIAVDKNANLIVVDQVSGRVKVFPPPYRHDQRRLGYGYYDPFHVHINRRNTRVYVSDAGDAVVDAIDYQTGRIVGKYSYFNYGLGQPFDAVDGPNAVY
jgi:DNA-binding beta-propeller fold protein YncE